MAETTAPDDRSFVSRLVRSPLDLLRKLVRVVPAAIESYFRARLPQHAAAIAYRVLFSLAPLAIVLVSIVGIVLQDEGLRAEVIDWIVDLLPFDEDGSSAVEDAITRLASPTSALGLLSLVLFFWAASGMMAALRMGLEAALEVEHRRPAVRAKIVDLALVAGAGALLLASVAITVVSQVVVRVAGEVGEYVGLDRGLLGELLGLAVPMLVVTAAVMVLYRFVPTRRLRFRDTVAGGMVTGLLLVAISAASAFVYDQVAELSVIYGSITAVLVFLYSVYLYASAILFGAAFAGAWSAPPASGPAVPLREQVRRAVSGLFVRQSQPPPPSR
jgi:membrane protein